jgi:aspartate aminotransferase
LAADRLTEVRNRIVSGYTFSKSYAMTGWRLGYLVCSDDNFCSQVKKMILYTINGVSTPTQYAGVAALMGPQDAVTEMCREYRKRRDMLFDGVNSSPYLTCERPPAGAFYLYAQITDAWEGSAWDLVNHLIDQYAMGSVPGDIFYDEQKSIRFSYACSTAMIAQAIARLSAREPAHDR